MENNTELRCPNCGNGQVYSRKKTNDMRCVKCDHIGKPEDFERKEA